MIDATEREHATKTKTKTKLSDLIEATEYGVSAVRLRSRLNGVLWSDKAMKDESKIRKDLRVMIKNKSIALSTAVGQALKVVVGCVEEEDVVGYWEAKEHMHAVGNKYGYSDDDPGPACRCCGADEIEDCKCDDTDIFRVKEGYDGEVLGMEDSSVAPQPEETLGLNRCSGCGESAPKLYICGWFRPKGWPSADEMEY